VPSKRKNLATWAAGKCNRGTGNSYEFYRLAQQKAIMIMNTKLPMVTAVCLVAISFLPGCRLIGDIFKAGVWTGILLVAVIIGLIIFVIAKLGKKQ
jgi:hypothetical protein